MKYEITKEKQETISLEEAIEEVTMYKSSNGKVYDNVSQCFNADVRYHRDNVVDILNKVMKGNTEVTAKDFEEFYDEIDEALNIYKKFIGLLYLDQSFKEKADTKKEEEIDRSNDEFQGCSHPNFTGITGPV